LKVYIDADSCPRVVRDMVIRACRKQLVPLVLAANRAIPHEEGPGVEMRILEKEPGAVDQWLLDVMESGDLLITRDIPLAARTVERGILTLNDRGDVFSGEDLASRLLKRDWMEELRAAGVARDGARNYGNKERDAFARTFDREFHRLLRARESKGL